MKLLPILHLLGYTIYLFLEKRSIVSFINAQIECAMKIFC